MEITEEQRKRAEANRLAALAKRKATLTATPTQEPWKLFKCRKISGSSSTDLNFPKPQPANIPEKFRVKLEICSPDSFSATPEPVEGFEYPGEAVCLQKLYDCLSDVNLFKFVFTSVYISKNLVKNGVHENYYYECFNFEGQLAAKSSYFRVTNFFNLLGICWLI